MMCVVCVVVQTHVVVFFVLVLVLCKNHYCTHTFCSLIF